MKAKDVQAGKVYVVKVSGKLAPVRITGTKDTGKRIQYVGVNLNTNRAINIRSAARLRYEWVGNSPIRLGESKTAPLSPFGAMGHPQG